MSWDTQRFYITDRLCLPDFSQYCTDAIFLDSDNGFDKVAQRLLLKLLSLKIDAQAITKREAFFGNHNKFAYSKNCSCPVSYGVMLGTVFGPILLF